MPQNDEKDGRHQGVGAVGDIGRERISVGKQDEAAQKDQIDTQCVAERMLPLPVIPDIGHVIFPLKVQIHFSGYNFIAVPNSSVRVCGVSSLRTAGSFSLSIASKRSISFLTATLAFLCGAEIRCSAWVLVEYGVI